MNESSTDVPVVSLGMPVFNGERFVAEAIRSVLAQTFSDFELVICDNASSDGTERICRDFAGQDPRIRFFRNPTNIGAHPNYNLTFQRSRGRYFKWFAHDDLLQPRYLAECVALMQADPGVVLCQSDLQFIDEHGTLIGVVPWRLGGTTHVDPVRRFACVVIERHNCYDFTGLHRREVLAQAPLQSFHGADRALLAHVATMGRFGHVSMPLMTVRDHDTRYTRTMTRPADRAKWTDPRTEVRYSFPHWSVYGSYWRSASRVRGGIGTKLRASAVLVAWWFTNWNAVRMALDPVALFAPDIVSFAEHFKQKHFSPAPGVDEIRGKSG